MKRCSACKKIKPLNKFGLNSNKKDGRQTSCKNCRKRESRLWYKMHKEQHLKNVKQNKISQTERNTKFIYKLLSNERCVDCGETNSIVLEFDHLRDKKLNISEMRTRGYSLNKLQEEISKCEIVCANCHRIRTYKRIGAKKLNWQ